jgi:hypothetical protein
MESAVEIRLSDNILEALGSFLLFSSPRFVISIIKFCSTLLFVFELVILLDDSYSLIKVNSSKLCFLKLLLSIYKKPRYLSLILFIIISPAILIYTNILIK